MNICFMNKKNAVKFTDRFGEEKTVYVPDFNQLRSNASCQDEIDCINDTENFIKEGKCFKGFTFEIVFMQYAKSLNPYTCKWEWKWQMMQFPWYRTVDCIYHTREQMIQEIYQSCGCNGKFTAFNGSESILIQ